MGCSPTTTPPKTREASTPPVAEVEVVPVESRLLEKTIQATGSLEPFERSELGFKVTGMIASVKVDVGTVVQSGDLVAELDRSDFESRVEQAEAALAQAQARLGIPLESPEDTIDPPRTPLVQEANALLAEATATRTRLARLKEQGIVPDSEIEATEAAFRVAESRAKQATQEALTQIAALRQRRAELNAAKRQLNETQLRAPFDGVVQERLRGTGEYLTAGQPVATLVRISPMRLRLKIPERFAPLVEEGQSIRFTPPGGTATTTASISRISPVLSESNRMLMLEADIPPGRGLRPGMFLSAEVVVDPALSSLMIPRDALIQFAGVESAFVVEAGKAMERRISTGRERDGAVEVLTGLTAGDQVVRRPGNLRPGQPVRERERGS